MPRDAWRAARARPTCSSAASTGLPAPHPLLPTAAAAPPPRSPPPSPPPGWAWRRPCYLAP
eukprot:scaffold114522_cov30-Phaeocystis_antarctica.AAC.1